MFLAVAAASLFSPASQAIDPPMGQASYTYDANNRLTKVVYSNARTVSYTYDNNGNLTNLATDGGTTGIVLKNGTVLTGIAGSEGTNKLYNFDVIAGQTLLEVKISGGTGDCDLEVSNADGTVKKYSLNYGNTETIRISLSNLAKETWRVNLIYKTDVSGLSLTAKSYNGTPLAPAGLKATDGIFTDKIVLTWTESAGASSYLVYRNDTGTTSAGAKNIAEVEDTTFTDMGTPALPLDPTKTYTYFVKAKRASTESLFSTGDAGYITKIPAMPASVTTSAGTYFDKIRVTWPITPDMASSTYNIYRLPVTEKAITGATAASPCVITAKNHEYATNDTIMINGIAGTMGDNLNGNKYAVTVIDANTFSISELSTIPVDTKGKTYTSGGTANLIDPFNKELGPISASNPCVITSPSHPFLDGDTVLICGVTGTMGPLLNGKSFAVTFVDTDTFFVPVDTRLKKYISGGTAKMPQIVKTLPAQAGITGLYDDLPDPLTGTHEPTTAHSYYYWVEVIGKTGSSPLKICTTPGYLSKKGPATVTATAGTLLGKVRISWTAVAGATGYDVYRYTDKNNTLDPASPFDAGAALTYDDTSATVQTGTTDHVYYYKVKAKYNTYYESDFNLTAAAGYHKQIAGPSSVTASAGTYLGKVHVTWTAVPGADSYEVYRYTDKNGGGEVKIPVGNVTYIDDISAAIGTSYYYKVKAKANGFPSAFNTTAAAGYHKTQFPGPAAVLASAGTYIEKIRVTWTAVLGADAYDVYRYTDKNGGGEVKIPVGNVTSYDDTPALVSSLTPYYYKVKAKATNGGGYESLFNLTASSGYHKAGPATVTATAGTLYDRVRITWTAVLGADAYDVYRYTDKIGSGEIQIPITPTMPPLTCYDTTATKGTHYSYKVRAKVGAFTGNPSTALAEGYIFAGTTVTLAAPTLTASKDLYTYVKLTWTDIPLAKDYIIYKGTSNVFASAAEIKRVNAPALTYDDNATPGVLYYYWIKSNNDIVVPSKISLPSIAVQGRALGAATPILNGGKATVAGGKDSCVYYSIVVPPSTTRLVATLTNTGTALINDCDLYLKLGSCPTTTSFNVKGTESLSGETATVLNPVSGTWYIMLYGVTAYGGTPSTDVTLKVDYYSVADIILTQVPVNNQIVPFTASFKGRVVDESGVTGITGLNVKVRDPLRGTITTLATKTDATGYFTYTTTINFEGEFTYDFYFDKFPETGVAAKGTASHTVCTRIGASSGYSGLFDSSAYLPATPVPLLNLTDTTGMQTFLNIRNGWDPAGTIDSTYEDLWVNSTIIKANDDSAIVDKCIDGLFIVFYGVEGAGAGNDMTATSALSAVPLVLHVTPGANLTTVLNNLGTGAGNLGVITDSQKADILAGNLGLLAITVLKGTDETVDTPSDLSLTADDKLSLISDLMSNVNTTAAGTADYSGVTTTIFTIDLYGDGARKINIVTVAY